MLAGMISQIFLGIATGYAPEYYSHIFFRCAVAATCSLQCIGIMTLADITSGKYRVGVVCLFEQFWSVGVILLPLMSHWWSSWSIVYIAITLPTFILMAVYPWIPDSPRWLIKHGKVDEAMQVILKGAEINKNTNFSKDELKTELRSLSIQAQNESEATWTSIWEGSCGHKFKLFIAHIGWSVFLMLYFAYLLHVRAMGRNYLPVNTVIAGVSEIIGTFIGLYLILNTSKKWLWTSLLNIAASLVALSANLVPDTVPPFQRMMIFMVTAMTAKATVSTTLSIFITCTTELVSKEKKKICNYSGVSTSRTLVMIAPFIGYCVRFGQLVPQNIMVTMNITMSVLIMLFISTPRTIVKTKSYIPEELMVANGKEVTRL